MPDLSGQSIGRYHILEQLGEGGMATVYKAYDTRLERNVALKVIRLEKTADPHFLKRFEREAKALAQLEHPNIVHINDYGEHDGAPYLVMSFIPSGTLKQHTGSPMDYRKAAALLAPIAHALEYAHGCKIIHRDIKPANILITQSGQPMLSDFGIARILDLDETSDLTSTSMGVGTPAYMAPEQARRDFDHRVDIYALGIVFYELVTGRQPYRADTPLATLMMHASDPLPRPRLFVPGLPDSVEQVLFKALAKKPQDRFPSMAEFAAALEKLAQGQKVDGGLPPPDAASKPKPAALLVGGLILLVAVLTGLVFYLVFGQDRGSPALLLQPADTAGATPTSASPDPSKTPLPASAVYAEPALDGSYTWDFETDNGFQGWGSHDTSGLTSLAVRDGFLFMRSSNADPYIYSSTNLNMNVSSYPTITIRMKVSSGWAGAIYWQTDKDANWGEDKVKTFAIRPGEDFQVYHLDMSENFYWKDTITELRLDPTDIGGTDIVVDYIRLEPVVESTETSPLLTPDGAAYGCALGSRLLYTNDFEKPGSDIYGKWTVETAEENNKVLHMSGSGSLMLKKSVSESRIAYRIRHNGSVWGGLYFRSTPQDLEYRLDLASLTLGYISNKLGSEVHLAQGTPIPKDQWMLIEMVWLEDQTMVVKENGSEILRYAMGGDRMYIDNGNIWIGLFDETSEIWLDDIVVCE